MPADGRFVIDGIPIGDWLVGLSIEEVHGTVQLSGQPVHIGAGGVTMPLAPPASGGIDLDRRDDDLRRAARRRRRRRRVPRAARAAPLRSRRHCKPVAIAASPAAQAIVIETPAMRRLP